MSFARMNKLAFVGSEQDQFRIDRFNGARNCIGEFPIPHGHVIKRAMRLHMIRLHIQGRSDRLKNSKLISHGVEHFFVRYRQLLTSKILAIEKARMRSDSYSLL